MNQPDIPGIPSPPKKRGRPSKEGALSGAERQLRYREKLREIAYHGAPHLMTVAQALVAYRIAMKEGERHEAIECARRLLYLAQSCPPPSP